MIKVNIRVLWFTQATTYCLLQSQIDSIVNSPQDGTMSTAEQITAVRAVWLYGLLARIHKPVVPETTSSMHTLLQFCFKKRVEIDENEVCEVLPILNILVLILGVYFGQDETYAGIVDVGSE